MIINYRFRIKQQICHYAAGSVENSGLQGPMEQERVRKTGSLENIRQRISWPKIIWNLYSELCDFRDALDYLSGGHIILYHQLDQESQRAVQALGPQSLEKPCQKNAMSLGGPLGLNLISQEIKVLSFHIILHLNIHFNHS